VSVTLTGLNVLEKRFDAMLTRKRKELVAFRKTVTMALLEEIITHLPVWSGRTVRSVTVTSGASNLSVESHPDRGDTAKDGRWLDHTKQWGDTKRMPLGPEKNRASAQSIARASGATADYSLDKPVFIESNSYNFGEVNTGKHREPMRVAPVVTQLALQQIKSVFGKAVQ